MVDGRDGAGITLGSVIGSVCAMCGRGRCASERCQPHVCSLSASTSDLLSHVSCMSDGFIERVGSAPLYRQSAHQDIIWNDPLNCINYSMAACVARRDVWRRHHMLRSCTYCMIWIQHPHTHTYIRYMSKSNSRSNMWFIYINMQFDLWRRRNK